MVNKKRRRNPGKLIFLGIIILVCFYVVFTLVEQQQEMADLKRQEEEVLLKIEATQKEVDRITNSIESANTEQYIEKIAREQLKMIGSDEVIFIDLGKNNK